MEAIRASDAKRVTAPVTSGEKFCTQQEFQLTLLTTSSDWHYTVPYPREYVEYLEEQQEQLSAGLLVMYRLLKESHIKTVPPLPDKLQAQDLLSALRSLRLDPQHHHPAYNHHRNASGLHNGTIMNMNDNMFAEHNRRPPSQLHSPFDPGPTSPTSVLSSSFHSPRPDMNASNIPTTAPASFPPVTYGPAFEFTRPSQPKVIVNQTHGHSLPSDHATSPGVGLSSSGFVAQEPWHHDGSHHPLSPLEHPLQRSRRTSGESPSQGFVVDTGQPRNDGNVHHSNNWGWNGETGLGVGFYGSSNLAASAHDSNAAMDWESIEQRGEIVVPHDSHAQHLHGKWHGAPLN